MVVRRFPRCKLNYVNQKLFERAQIINFENSKFADSGKGVRLFIPDVLSP